MNSRAQSKWTGIAAVLAVASVWPMPSNSQSTMPETPEPFAEMPEELEMAASDAIAEVDWLVGATLEYIVVATDKGSKIFKAANIPETVYKVDEIQDPEAGKIVRLPKWSSKTGAELIDPVDEDVQQYIVIITSSPGSGNDCRRGGTCRSADGGG